MPQPPSKPPSKVVFDTGPLFTGLTLVFIRQRPTVRDYILHEHKLPQYITDPTTERAFLAFFDCIREVLTTSHVIGQIKSRRSVAPDVYREFMLSSMDFLNRKGLSERLVTLLSMREDDDSRRLVCTVGPTDAGLVTLARQENCLLLTDDSRLFGCCDKDGKPKIELAQNFLTIR